MMIRTITLSKPSLAAAAEALIEAASLEADAFTNKQLVTNLDSLKTSFDINLNKVVQKMESSNENFDVKINTLNQNLESLRSDMAAMKSDMAALKTLMQEDRKQKILEGAKSMTALKSFTYYDSEGYSHSKQTSDALARNVIEWFLCGYGYILPDAQLEQYSQNKEQNKKEFRDKFVKQIQVLIQREPRLVDKGNGSWAIHYS